MPTGGTDVAGLHPMLAVLFVFVDCEPVAHANRPRIEEPHGAPVTRRLGLQYLFAD